MVQSLAKERIPISSDKLKIGKFEGIRRLGIGVKLKEQREASCNETC
jgi:hypothetical protein